MKIKLLGKNLSDIRPLLGDFGFEEDDDNFDLIITHGGDGALLGAERDYPGIPKFPIRDATTALPCPKHTPMARLEHFCSDSRTITSLPKLCGEHNNERLLGINDICVHNQDSTSALRYRVFIDDALYADEIVGDGIVLASVHGSTAYYRSITHSMFQTGIGLAFNNSTEEVNHLVLNTSSIIRVEILRGPGVLSGDNDPKRIIVPEGGVITLKQDANVATVYDLAEFMCPTCRAIRHPHRKSVSLPR